VLGFAGDIQYLLSHSATPSDHFIHVALKIAVVWGYCMLAINTVLTGAIAGKIMCVLVSLASALSCSFVL
jgi:hypothetical protein